MNELEKGIEMVERLGDNYLYVREIEDKAFSDGLRTGSIYAICVVIILTLIAVIIIV